MSAIFSKMSDLLTDVAAFVGPEAFQINTDLFDPRAEPLDPAGYVLTLESVVLAFVLVRFEGFEGFLGPALQGVKLFMKIGDLILKD